MADNLDNLADKLAAEAEAGEMLASEVAHQPTELDANKDRNLQLILDIPLRVTVELGRTKMPVNELLNLGQGSVIELNKLAGEPMERLAGPRQHNPDRFPAAMKNLSDFGDTDPVTPHLADRKPSPEGHVGGAAALSHQQAICRRNGVGVGQHVRAYRGVAQRGRLGPSQMLGQSDVGNAQNMLVVAERKASRE